MAENLAVTAGKDSSFSAMSGMVIFGLAKSQGSDITEVQPNETPNTIYSTMTAPKTIKAALRLPNKRNKVGSINLRPIEKKIDQAIKEVWKWKPPKKHNSVTCTVTKVPKKFVEVTICVKRPTGPENSGSGKPPKIVR